MPRVSRALQHHWLRLSHVANGSTTGSTLGFQASHLEVKSNLPYGGMNDGGYYVFLPATWGIIALGGGPGTYCAPRVNRHSWGTLVFLAYLVRLYLGLIFRVQTGSQKVFGAPRDRLSKGMTREYILCDQMQDKHR